MLESLKNFKIEEISDWIKEYLRFIINPKKVIDSIFEKKNDEILRQFLFYFLLYTASFLFLSLSQSTSISQWIKPAIINLFTTIPLIILFIITTNFFKKKYAKSHIIAYVFGFQFIATPIAILIFATFLTTENYTYKFLFDIFSSIAIIYLFFNFGFAIEEKTSKALKITFVNYLILNLLYFGFKQIDVDPYSYGNFNQTDPIYLEYSELVKPLKDKEILPTNHIVTVYKDNIETYFSLSEIIMDTISQYNDQLNSDFLISLDENILHLKEKSENLKFHRNQYASALWLEYFYDIKTEVEFKYNNISQISELNLKPLPIEEVNDFGVQIYLVQTDLGKMLKTQIPLKSYHNSTIQNHKNSTLASEVSHRIIFFIGYVLDYIIGDLILKQGEPRVYKEIFLELE
jgi:hypothetical protein